MNRLLKIVSFVALLGVLLPSVAYLAGALNLETVKWVMIAATIAWFTTTPIWMGGS